MKTNRASRRDFLKLGAVGAVSMLGAPSFPKDAVAKAPLGEMNQTSFTYPSNSSFDVRDDYRPFHMKNTLFSAALTGRKPQLMEKMLNFMSTKFDNSKAGFTQLDYALMAGGFSFLEAVAPGSGAGFPNIGINDWAQRTKEHKKYPFELDILSDTQCRFESKKQASAAIKRAARLYGADLVGITKRDQRWDYAGFVDPNTGEEYGWERFPFEPKTVIVLGFEMENEAYAAAPTYTSEGTTGDRYSQMAKTAFQVAVFLKKLGYPAVSAGNDTGLSVPYAIAAGLGESSRIGIVVTHKYGPRVRLAKVYTDFDFVDYDEPVSFGVSEFCERCMRCADACPAKAISRDPAPTFDPTYESDEKWFHNPGVKKYYSNTMKCFEYWLDANCGCGACITACPYNKPDFWQHRLIHKLTAVAPGPMHGLMRDMDIAFGYGNTFDENAIADFWSAKNRKYLGY